MSLSGVGSNLSGRGQELLGELSAIEGDWPRFLSFLDSAGGVRRLADKVLSQGEIGPDEVAALVKEAKDFGEITDAERSVLTGLLNDHAAQFESSAREALAAFLGLPVPEVGGDNEPPVRPPAEQPTDPASWQGHGRDVNATVLASRLEETVASLEASGAAGLGGSGGATATSEAEAVDASAPVAAGGGTQDVGRLLAEGGQRYLNEAMNAHRESIERTGVGTLYGDHSPFKDMSPEARARWIKENATPGTTPPKPRESSCIGWVYENVGAAYKAAGMEERWAEIKKIVVAKGSKGTDLAKELQKDGWQAIYFNPDTRHPEDGDAEHTYTARMVKKGKPYYGIEVDDVVTDYRPTPGAGTKLDTSGYEKLKKVPFFFGLARGGMHTFVGQNGRVNEFHWTSMPDDPNAIEERPLPEFPWNSGVIMVPPGTWPSGS